MRLARPIIAVAIVALAALIPTAATATQPPHHKVTVCHATPADTAADGWHRIRVDIASSGYVKAGHSTEHDADIIPPYTYGSFSFPGKNWDAAGQAIHANGCDEARVVIDPTARFLGPCFDPHYAAVFDNSESTVPVTFRWRFVRDVDDTVVVKVRTVPAHSVLTTWWNRVQPETWMRVRVLGVGLLVEQLSAPAGMYEPCHA